MCRAYTSDEVREELLDHLRGLVKYWSEQPETTMKDKMNGLIFSTLVVFDGGSMGLPAFDITAQPHEDDKEYHKKEGSNWYEPGTSVYDTEGPGGVALHEMWYPRKEK